jgi:hypothetical protein
MGISVCDADPLKTRVGDCRVLEVSYSSSSSARDISLGSLEYISWFREQYLGNKLILALHASFHLEEFATAL